MNQPRPFAPRGAGEIRTILEDLRAELANVENQLQDAHEVAEQAEERWTEHLDEVIDQLEEETDGRLPGEDLRNSIARRRGGAEAWHNHRRAERVVKKLEKRSTMLGNQIGSAQSEAKLMGVR